MAKQMAFYFDASVCTGCKACSIACKDKNDLPLGVIWRRVVQYGNGNWVKQGPFWAPNQVFSYYISSACNHCESPICKEVCPAAAISKRDDGIVLIDQTKCVGCRYCEWACPYGAPQFNEAKGVMTKCNFCEDLQAQGQNPVCVDACVMRALEFGELDQLRAKYGNENSIEPLPAADLTEPALVITPHRHSQPSGQGTGKIIGFKEA